MRQSLVRLLEKRKCFHASTNTQRHNSWEHSSSVERKNGSTTIHLHTQSDPFASLCTLLDELKVHPTENENLTVSVDRYCVSITETLNIVSPIILHLYTIF